MELGKQINDVIISLTHTIILNDVANQIIDNTNDKTYTLTNDSVRLPIWDLVCDIINLSIDDSINNK
jgi:hypothetical protein